MTAGRSNSKTLSVHWGTPIHLVKAVRKVFNGSIGLDPCSNQWSLVNAENEYKLPSNDGLIKKWNFETIYVNPPYGRDTIRKTSIKDWLAKCVKAHLAYDSEVIALIPVSPNTSHWKQYVWKEARSICFLYDTRLKFNENGISSKKGAPMACAVIYWGINPKKFASVFCKHGAIINLTNIQLPNKE